MFLREGFPDVSKLRGNVEATKRYAIGFGGISNIQVWTDENIEEIYNELL
jgi:hypothetical protein